MERLKDGRKVPCEPDCPRRGPRCHSECKEYVEWQQCRFKELEEQNRQRDVEDALVQMKLRWGDRRK